MDETALYLAKYDAPEWGGEVWQGNPYRVS